MKNKLLVLSLCVGLFCGCGYTTKGFMYNEDRIVIKPIVNKVDITFEGRRNSDYTVYPVLLEKRLTNTVISKFNINGGLKVVSFEEGALRLSGEITNYQKESLRYTDSKGIEEQRLRLFVNMKLIDAKDKVLKDKEIVGETSYFLSGANSETEESAQTDLIDDTARRILEAVVEEW
jgi:hypothetical protein